MLGVRVPNGYLKLNPGTVLELEEQNPFLQFSNEIEGDVSLPFEVSAADNLDKLGYAGLLQTKVSTTGIEASIEDSGLQHSIGKIKVEKPSVHLNNVQEGSISLYYVSGVASFYQDIKDKKLRDVELGGDRTFAWDNYQQSGPGFWAHITQVMNASDPQAYDYCFFPMINKAWQGEVSSTYVMNDCGWLNTYVAPSFFTTDKRDGNVLVPFPWLHYVLRKTVESVGWRIEGAVLNDPDFLKICMVNFKAIHWCDFTPKTIVLGQNPKAFPTITFNLQDHLPDFTIAEFLIAVKNRFGWWYEFDRRHKVIRVRALNEVMTTTSKDFTRWASPVVVKSVQTEPKIYALKNEFVGEYANGTPDLKQTDYKGTVTTKAALPAPSQSNSLQCYLVIAENNYYICRQNEGSGAYEWQFFAYNVYNVEPDGYTEEITTKATTLGSEYISDYLDLVPRMDQNGIWVGRGTEESTWGIHLVMYHGLQLNKQGKLVPFASSAVYNSLSQQVAQWSLAFECKTLDGTDVGLYQKNWKSVLERLKEYEGLEVSVRLPKAEYLNLKFSDEVVVAGVKMLVKTIKSTVPYAGSVQLEGVRV